MIDPEMVLTRYEGKGGLAIASDGGYVVALDTMLTDDLREEGRAREIVRIVQDMRKQAGYAITDRIVLEIAGDVPLPWRGYIASETLAEYGPVGVPDSERSINERGEDILVRIALR
jgi:isoleucyl-tRNA synthetase